MKKTKVVECDRDVVVGIRPKTAREPCLGRIFRMSGELDALPKPSLSASRSIERIPKRVSPPADRTRESLIVVEYQLRPRLAARPEYALRAQRGTPPETWRLFHAAVVGVILRIRWIPRFVCFEPKHSRVRELPIVHLRRVSKIAKPHCVTSRGDVFDTEQLRQSAWWLAGERPSKW